MTNLIGTVMSGTEFNRIFKPPYYTFMRQSDELVFCPLKIGLNIDKDRFNPTKLVFCDESHCHHHYKYQNKIALIEIPNTARIYIEKNFFRASRYIVKSITDYEKMSDDFWIKIIKYDGLALRNIKNQTDEICKLAVQQNDYALEYVKNQTNEICK